MSPHLLVVPIVLPLLAAALQLLAGERRQRTAVALGLASCLGLVATAAALVLWSDRPGSNALAAA